MVTATTLIVIRSRADRVSLPIIPFSPLVKDLRDGNRRLEMASESVYHRLYPLSFLEINPCPVTCPAAISSPGPWPPERRRPCSGWPARRRSGDPAAGRSRQAHRLPVRPADLDPLGRRPGHLLSGPSDAEIPVSLSSTRPGFRPVADHGERFLVPAPPIAAVCLRSGQRGNYWQGDVRRRPDRLPGAESSVPVRPSRPRSWINASGTSRASRP